MGMDKVCLTTYVFGDKYQDYIPFLVYSCHVAYPDYDLVLFIHGKLREEIRAQIDLIGKQNLFLKEKAYDECPKMSSLKARCMRWVLYDDRFLQYDYLYIVDIDILYIREPMPLHVQHVLHMKKTGMPYDNIVRHFTRHPLKIVSLARRIKYAGLVSFGKYLIGSRDDYRITGLHFVRVKDYFAILDAQTRDKYLQMIYDGSLVKLSLSANDEAIFYEMLFRAGLHPERLAVQTNSYTMLDFNNPERDEFRPHHGIHLGIFRQDLSNDDKQKKVLDSEVYMYYAAAFKEKYADDPLFRSLLEMSSEGIKKQFDNLFRYYGIQIIN